MNTNTAIEHYLLELRRHLAGMSTPDVEDIIVEIRTHLTEQTLQARNAEAAIAQLGNASDLAALYKTERFVRAAGDSHSPPKLLAAAFRLSQLGLRWIFIAAIGLVCYGVSLSLVLTALMKPFFPGNVGLWWGRSIKAIGFYSNPSLGHELLGWWVIPLGLGLGTGLILCTTAVLRRVVRSVRPVDLASRSASQPTQQ